MSLDEDAPETIEPVDDEPEAEEAETAGSSAGPVCLTYVGSGRYIIGVPTKDLCQVPADDADRLVETGLYVRADCADGAEAPPGE